MKLFGKKNNTSTDIIRLRQSFSRVYLDCNQLLLDSFVEMGLTNNEIADDTDIQNGLLTLHSLIVTISQSTIKDKAKVKIATELLFYFENMMVTDFSISISKLQNGISQAHKAYMESLTDFTNNSPGTDVPILSAVKTIESLSDFYTNKGQLNMMMQLPVVEQEMLTRYKQYWLDNL